MAAERNLERSYPSRLQQWQLRLQRFVLGKSNANKHTLCVKQRDTAQRTGELWL